MNQAKKGRSMSREEVFQVLMKAGHTPGKAVEISLDFERGDEWARAWVAAIQSPNWPLRRITTKNQP